MSYRRQFLIVWDNFDYNEEVHHVTLASRGEHVSTTTGLVLKAMFIPPEGIALTEFDASKRLGRDELVLVPGNVRDKIDKDIEIYCLIDALRYVHGKVIDEKLGDKAAASLPCLERLGAMRTEARELGPISANEGTISATYQVIHTILKKKLRLREDDPVFGESLQLTFVDQKTVSLIQTVKRDSDQSRYTYGAMRYLLPIPGLLHFRMNFLDLIDTSFRGKDDGLNSVASLHENTLYMGIAKGNQMLFHQKEEAIIRCFYARVVAMLYSKISRQCDVEDPRAVDAYLQSLSPETLMHNVQKLQEAIWGDRRLHSEKPDDMVFAGIVQFIDIVRVYLTLKDAIRCADLGLIKRCLARSSLFLPGSNKRKYASLSLYMTWLTHSAATSERLKKAVLANGLVNLRGSSNSWFEIDRLNEFLNLRLKTAMRFKRTSTESLSSLFERVAKLSEYASQVKVSMEALAGERTNARHQMKKAQLDVTRLAYHLHMSGVVVDASKRESALKPPSHVARAMNNDIRAHLDRFAALYCNANAYDAGAIDTLGAELDADRHEREEVTDIDQIPLEARDLIDEDDYEGMRFLLDDDDISMETFDIDAGSID
ncbi:hypothetical protein KEM55_002166 [Ascosphaera atra]|nr:hypothetical protein KEM55_002166 [Ascosphaera atra]